MTRIEDRLKALDIILPKPAAPVANYVPYVISGSWLVISGQIALDAEGKLDSAHMGKLGGSVSIEAGQAAARRCAINLLAQAKAALGDLERINRCVRLGGFINVHAGFSAVALVMNGASDFIVDILGDRGRHARSTIGVAELPLDSAVEIEGLFEIVA
jgi:enamine deaminase RidA (YjgF/YER057c/UK114 family)